MSLFQLIEKILTRKNLQAQATKTPAPPKIDESIEVITFETEEEILCTTLKFAQIKLHTYILNNEQFLFLQFQNNQEREEILR